MVYLVCLMSMYFYNTFELWGEATKTWRKKYYKTLFIDFYNHLYIYDYLADFLIIKEYFSGKTQN